MESLSLVLSLLVVVAVLAVAGACTQSNTADQLFSLAISDNSGGSKNGAPVPALKFRGETPRATTVMAKKSIPTLTAILPGDSYTLELVRYYLSCWIHGSRLCYYRGE